MKKMIDVFGVKKPILGMLHLTGCGRKNVLENAQREIDIMYCNGVDAVLVENYFGDKVDVGNALKLLQKDYPHKVYGVNMLVFRRWLLTLLGNMERNLSRSIPSAVI